MSSLHGCGKELIVYCYSSVTLNWFCYVSSDGSVCSNIHLVGVRIDIVIVLYLGRCVMPSCFSLLLTENVDC